MTRQRLPISSRSLMISSKYLEIVLRIGIEELVSDQNLLPIRPELLQLISVLRVERC